MWTRTELKTRAKGFLRLHYWKSFVVALVLFFAGATDNILLNSGNNSRASNHGGASFRVGSFDFSERIRSGGQIRLDLGDVLMGGSSNLSGWFIERIGVPAIIMVSAMVAFSVILLVIGFRVFIGAPLAVGGRKFFVKGIRQETDIFYLSDAFKSPHYLNIVKVMFLRALYNFLWYLLLIIPGIVKHYAYRMVPYLLAEDPAMDADQAIRKSMDMTQGHKLDMFILDVSFIGWYLVGALLLGIGILFVNPYYEATYAQLYDALDQKPDKVMPDPAMQWLSG